MDEQNPQRYSGEEHYYEPGVKITPPPPSSGSRRPIMILSVVLAVLLIVVIILATALVNSHQQAKVPPKPTNVPTMQPTNAPTIQPTETPTVQPTDTPTVQSADTPTVQAASTPGIATTGPSNIRLKCTCSDPVLVTITKINMQPQQNRMLWSLTLQNVSPNSAGIDFRQFYLQQGDLISNPTSGEQEYPATGGAANNTVSLQPSGQPGDIQTTTLTFLFMPYATSYTLTSILDPCQGFCDPIPLDPAVIQFR